MQRLCHHKFVGANLFFDLLFCLGYSVSLFVRNPNITSPTRTWLFFPNYMLGWLEKEFNIIDDTTEITQIDKLYTKELFRHYQGLDWTNTPLPPPHLIASHEMFIKTEFTFKLHSSNLAKIFTLLFHHSQLFHGIRWPSSGVVAWCKVITFPSFGMSRGCCYKILPLCSFWNERNRRWREMAVTND